MNMLYEMMVSIGLATDDFDRRLNEVEGRTERQGSKIGAKFAAVGKAALAGFTVAAGAVSVIGKSAIEAYKSFEQLSGGVQTLFGEISSTVDASADVMRNAANAYKTAGISANEYMETVTSFSASLMSSLGNDAKAAANVADMAIKDMADNANKMGTSMESIQTAYQGFAKQQYMLLDNLKLGYGGTKTEMERLLKDAQAITGIKYDISNLNDVYQAIHVIQEQLGIAGTTAKEASTTIEGSMNAAKAAWQNLLVSIADENGNFEESVNNFVEAASTAGANLMPRIQQALKGVAMLITGLAPLIVSEIPKLTETILPELINAAGELLQALVNAFPAFIKTLSSLAPQFLEQGVQLLISLVEGLSETLPELIPVMVEAIITMTIALLENVDKLAECAIKLMEALAFGMLKAIPVLIAAVPKILVALKDAIINYSKTIIGEYKKVGQHIIDGIWEGINEKIGELMKKIQTVVNGIKSAFTGKIGFDIHSPSKWATEIGGFLMTGLSDGIESKEHSVNVGLKNMIDGMKKGFADIENLSKFDRTFESDFRFLEIGHLHKEDAKSSETKQASNYNFTFNSPKALSVLDAQQESKRAYREMLLGI
nr:MAG TPA: tail tape measure protein [Caudoviricetes sp.]